LYNPRTGEIETHKLSRYWFVNDVLTYGTGPDGLDMDSALTPTIITFPEVFIDWVFEMEDGYKDLKYQYFCSRGFP
jgi:hypothetical protein